jgi:hypothetical protein
MRDVGPTGLDRAMPNVGAVLDELEAVGTPTDYARGKLAAVKLCKLAAAEQVRVDALARKWIRP